MSVNAVDQTTGNTTPIAGNTNNLVGNLSALTTNTKSDAVGAINEVNQTKQNATDNNLQTTDKTIVGGINELRSGLTNVETLQTLSPDALLNGDITIKRNCGIKFVLCHNMILKNDLAASGTLELCASGTVLNPPTEDTIFQIYAKSGGNDIAPVNLVLKADGSIIVINFSSVSTKLYGYCCGAYI